MPTEELLYQMEAALAAGDLTVAHSVLAQLRTTLSAQSAWLWFRQHEPESYDELLEKLRLAQSWYSRRLPAGRSGKYEVQHLIEVFEWCRDHGIALSELGPRGKMGNCREADPRLRGVIRDETLSDDEKGG